MAVDIPTGWSVDSGPPGDSSQPHLNPAVLVSLTSPKAGARSFRGPHYLGGRFIPPKMARDMSLNLPQYPGGSQIVKL
ncbi:MAG: hypothetical protein Q8P67_09980 [archaeon]|nr:hypothetical protein [archaeon]